MSEAKGNDVVLATSGSVASATVASLPNTEDEVQVVRQLMEHDHKSRVVGVEHDLIPLSDLVQKAWNNGLPTLENKDRDRSKTPRLCTSMAEFTTTLHRRFPILLKLDLGKHLLIAGGSIGQIIRPLTSSAQNDLNDGQHSRLDLDLFVYGLDTPELGNEQVRAFLANLLSALKNEAFHRQRIRIALLFALLCEQLSIEPMLNALDEFKSRKVQRKYQTSSDEDERDTDDDDEEEDEEEEPKRKKKTSRKRKEEDHESDTEKEDEEEEKEDSGVVVSDPDATPNESGRSESPSSIVSQASQPGKAKKQKQPNGQALDALRMMMKKVAEEARDAKTDSVESNKADTTVDSDIDSSDDELADQAAVTKQHQARYRAGRHKIRKNHMRKRSPSRNGLVSAADGTKAEPAKQKSTHESRLLFCRTILNITDEDTKTDKKKKKSASKKKELLVVSNVLTQKQASNIWNELDRCMQALAFVERARAGRFWVTDETLAKRLKPFHLHRYDAPKLSMIRSTREGCITVSWRPTKFVPSGKVQIILRLYKTVSEILHGFDLGSSAVGYDGKQVWLTSLSKFTYEYGCNIVDPRRRSPTFELRLAKYFARGFDLILPDLDVTKIGDETTNANLRFNLMHAVSMPFMSFTIRSIHGNRIPVDSFLGLLKMFMSDYDELDSDESADVPTNKKVLQANILNLIGKWDDEKQLPVKPLYCYTKRYELSAMLDQAQPHLSVAGMHRVYDKQQETLIKGGKLLDVRILNQFVTVKSTAEIVDTFISVANPLQQKAVVATAPTKLKPMKPSDVLQAAMQEQRTANAQRIARLPKQWPIVWRTLNPGAQLSSSMEPTPCSPQEWYGSLCK